MLPASAYQYYVSGTSLNWLLKNVEIVVWSNNEGVGERR